MSTHLAPYLHYPDNNAGDAFTHYGKVFGCEPTIQRVGDQPMPGTENMDPQMVMHAQLQSPDGINLYGSDDCAFQKLTVQGFEVCIMTDEADKGKSWFEGLAEGGSIDMPLERQPWGDTYGQLTDRFGIRWSVNISGNSAA